jgi:hydrogenase maturation protein HypF
LTLEKGGLILTTYGQAEILIGMKNRQAGQVEPPQLQRLRIQLQGAVQGVGFRPFVYRLATELGLKGWVNNSAQGLFIEAEGGRAELEKFLFRIESDKPPRSFIQSLESAWLDPLGYGVFEVHASDIRGKKIALVQADIATCPDCLREIFDPPNRRYGYPFTNCTNCGPRFSIIRALPYDRANTSMAGFTMCPQCQAEYDNPLDRRFHAQPNACQECGPHLQLWDSTGKVLTGGETFTRTCKSLDVLTAAADGMRRGAIVAVKGLGGFHLMVAAENEEAVRQLRERKHREEKPLAVMFPSLETVKQHCEVNQFEARLLHSPEAPIVLLRRIDRASSTTQHASGVGGGVAPGNPNLGVMVPYTPLHHVLLRILGMPVVATSGNRSDEPICIDEREALERLRGIADLFLVHNRPIVRQVDDSIVRVMLGREVVLRRARGYAPLPIRLREKVKGRPSSPQPSPPTKGGEGEEHALSNIPAALPFVQVSGAGQSSAGAGPAEGPVVLAVGAHLKNAVALSIGPQVFVSQHIGDLETEEAFGAFVRVIRDFERLYERQPAMVAADLHPDYLSTKFARESGLQVIGVQHHLAHVLSCMADNELEPPVLGVSWDGTGYGLDGTVWGGEFIAVREGAIERAGHFAPFPLPGGDKAVREPRRAALGLLYQTLGEAAFGMKALTTVQAFSDEELATLKTMIERGLNAPLTSSVGRLFDAVASLTGLRQRARFEGQAAMELEFALEGLETTERYPINVEAKPAAGAAPGWCVECSSLVKGIIDDVASGTKPGTVSARFHNTLVEAIVLMAQRIGESKVVLTGGCFQNRYLTEQAVERLRGEGVRPYWHQRIPPNDGGIALGQILAARDFLR